MSPFKRGNTWWGSIPSEDGRKRVSLETTNRAEAVKREAELRNKAERVRLGLEVREKNPRGLTMSQAVDLHLNGRAKKQAQLERLTYSLDKHIKRDELGAVRIEQVTSGVLNAWLDRREGSGAGATTQNRLRAYVSAIFSALIERELFIGENPARRVRPRKETQPKSRLLPAHAVMPLLEAAPTDAWQLALAFAAFAGMRRGEIERLRWDDIDTEARLLTIQKSKTGVRRVVGLHKELLELLSETKNKSDLVVPRAGWGNSAVIVQKALERAEVEIPAGVQACFHSLRHTWATRLIDCGADPFIVQLMGWGPPKSSVMATSYARPKAALLEAIDKLNWPEGKVLHAESQFRHRGSA